MNVTKKRSIKHFHSQLLARSIASLQQYTHKKRSTMKLGDILKATHRKIILSHYMNNLMLRHYTKVEKRTKLEQFQAEMTRRQKTKLFLELNQYRVSK